VAITGAGWLRKTTAVAASLLLPWTYTAERASSKCNVAAYDMRTTHVARTVSMAGADAMESVLLRRRECSRRSLAHG
jgi:hypothetical protein